MKEIFIPTLHTFAMNNSFTGSFGMLRFKAVPEVIMKTPKEVDMEASSITVEFWHGLFCYEKSEIEEERVFPLSPEGRLEMQQWLKDHA